MQAYSPPQKKFSILIPASFINFMRNVWQDIFKKGKLPQFEMFWSFVLLQSFLEDMNLPITKSNSTFSFNSHLIFIKAFPSLTDKPRLNFKLKKNPTQNLKNFVQALINIATDL